MSVSCKSCVLSGSGLCVGLITHPEESYRVWCVWYDREASIMRRTWPIMGCYPTERKKGCFPSGTADNYNIFNQVNQYNLTRPYR